MGARPTRYDGCRLLSEIDCLLLDTRWLAGAAVIRCVQLDHYKIALKSLQSLAVDPEAYRLLHCAADCAHACISPLMHLLTVSTLRVCTDMLLAAAVRPYHEKIQALIVCCRCR